MLVGGVWTCATVADQPGNDHAPTQHRQLAGSEQSAALRRTAERGTDVYGMTLVAPNATIGG